MSGSHDGDLGSILAVFAHPDDEAYLAGGLMAVAADAGRRVVCVTATRGELGFAEDDPRDVDERMAVRARELARCLEVLGVTEHHWLDQRDGGCAAADPAAPVTRLCELIEEVRPDTVLTFGPDGQTYHPDHIAVGAWTTRAVRSVGGDHRLLYAALTQDWIDDFSSFLSLDGLMMTDDPPPVVPSDDLVLRFLCDDALVERKTRALLCQESQVTSFVQGVGLETYTRLNREEAYREPRPDDWPR